ncbi:MAG: type II toxin-antitoxin system VapC family toxin [Terracidiphilus sp.]
MNVAEGYQLPWLLLDTHVLLWMVEDHPRLGAKTAKALNRTACENRIAVSAITPWEIALLVSKKRIDLHREPLEWVRSTLSLPGVHLVPIEPEIAVASTCLPFEMRPDPADRILVATARHLGATLVTADKALLDLAEKGHFRAMNAAK